MNWPLYDHLQSITNNNLKKPAILSYLFIFANL